MTNVVKIRKGLDLRLIGEVPDGIPGTLPAAGRYAVFPDDYYGIVPKLAKKEGEVVRAGEMVLYDKNNENVAIVSPVAGTVAKVVRGERRKILRVEIEADGSGGHFMLDVDAGDTDAVRRTLQRSGLWAYMRQRPYEHVGSALAVAVAMEPLYI